MQSEQSGFDITPRIERDANLNLKNIIYCLIGLFLLLASGIVSHRFDLLAGNASYRLIAYRVKSSLLKRLGHEHPIPIVKNVRPQTATAVAYILGGNQESLAYKIRIAGQLYRDGLIRKILVHRNPGITEYSPELGRNLTNDEWITMEIEKEGVAGNDVEFISYPPSFFGTFGEGRAVSHIARSRGISRLALVSSRHHMERAWLTFSRFSEKANYELFTYGSEENASIYDLLIECAKLYFYQYILLPGEGTLRNFMDRKAIRTPRNPTTIYSTCQRLRR
jgi:uncharacterized SAM-binding protein YcdF (DUF218 family)